jgi:NADPH2:quinone reductase
MCAEAFDLLGDPRLRIEIAARLPLAEASEAHRMLESRQTTGSIVLIP